LEALKARGLLGAEFVVSDDHPGLKKAIADVLTGVLAALPFAFPVQQARGARLNP
jgi:hypothetical protein